MSRNILSVKQTREDLLRHLREQTDFLRVSSAAFDQGNQSEAKRLATGIRILVHDTATAHSVLEQLGVKGQLRFVDTSLPPVEAKARLEGGRMVQTRRRDSGLATIQFGGGSVRYVAALGGRERRVPQPFRSWWGTPVLRDIQGNEFSRKDLVLGVAHLDGGAHVDPELKPAYAALTRSNSLGWEYGDGTTNLLLAQSPALANVRQVAYELLLTIEEQCRDLVNNP